MLAISSRLALAVALALGASLSAGAPAAAQESCSCSAAWSGGNVVGSITTIRGIVSVAGANGYVLAPSPSAVSIGSQFATAPDSSAQLSVASCSIPIAANASVSVSQASGNVCVQVVDETLPPQLFDIGIEEIAAGATLVGLGAGALVFSIGADQPESQ